MISIFITGVGGQGILLASVILGRVALAQGVDVKLSEVHGMSQRGGSVVSHVRLGSPGEQVLSPVIGQGDADILLAFEEIEALRWASWLNPETGRAYVNRAQIAPLPVLAGRTAYPQQAEQELRRIFPRCLVFDATSLAESAGSSRAVNTVLIGAMARATGIPREIWLQAVADSVKPAFREINQRAFDLGYEAGGPAAS